MEFTGIATIILVVYALIKLNKTTTMFFATTNELAEEADEHVKQYRKLAKVDRILDEHKSVNELIDEIGDTGLMSFKDIEDLIASNKEEVRNRTANSTTNTQ